MKEKKPKKKVDYAAMEKNPIAFEKYKKNFVTQTLRRATYRWPFKNMAKNKSKLERAFYQCAVCKNAFGPKDINLDHIIPVISVKTGFTTWDEFIDRLFVKTDEFQVLCEMDHNLKTQLENEMRRSYGQKEITYRKRKK